MSSRPDLIGEAGLQFFGRMSASISHELKNVLAIIKENSGLLDDYLNLTARGMPLDPERFQAVTRRIDTQTQRANTIIKTMNQFAHTVDSFCKPVDLNQVLDLLVALHNRLATMQQVTLEVQPAREPVQITTSPFVLLSALGQGVSFALPAVPRGAAMALATVSTNTGGEIIFSGLNEPGALSMDGFPGDQGDALLAALRAELKIDAATGRMTFVLPRK